MSTALDAGVPGSNLFRGCCFFFFIFLLGPKGTGGIISAYCKFGSVREVLFLRNFSHAKVRENKIIAKWRNQSSCCLLALVTNFDVANMSFNDHIRVYFRIYSSLCCYRSFYICTLYMLKGLKIKKK